MSDKSRNTLHWLQNPVESLFVLIAILGLHNSAGVKTSGFEEQNEKKDALVDFKLLNSSTSLFFLCTHVILDDISLLLIIIDIKM